MPGTFKLSIRFLLSMLTLLAVLMSTTANKSEAGEVSVEGMTASQILRAVGGNYDKEINNFKGFKQEELEWCWAATTKTIFYYLTGAELDESKLARINFKNITEHRGGSWGDGVASVSAQETCDPRQNECDHPGIDESALWLFHASMPYRRQLDVPSSLNLIRKSLDQNVPVAIGVALNYGLHSVLVYGAHYSVKKGAAPGARDSFELTFNIFDPDARFKTEADAHRLIIGTTYTNEFGTPSEWTGEVDAANVSVRSVTESACPFLTAEDQVKFCSSH